MKTVPIERLKELTDELTLEQLKIWVAEQLAEERAKALTAGALIELTIPANTGKSVTVRAKPLTKQFALHNSKADGSPTDYKPAGRKTLTYTGNGLAAFANVRTTLAAVLQLAEALEVCGTDWDDPKLPRLNAAEHLVTDFKLYR